MSINWFKDTAGKQAYSTLVYNEASRYFDFSVADGEKQNLMLGV